MSIKPKYEHFQLSDRAKAYIKSVVVPKYVRDSNCDVTQAWFEAFLENLEQIGYQVIRIPTSEQD